MNGQRMGTAAIALVALAAAALAVSLMPARSARAQDPTYVGSEACQTCHSGEYASFSSSGHPKKLVTPEDAMSRGVPLPAGYDVSDVWRVIGGFKWRARYINQAGYIITEAPPGTPGNNQYNLWNGTWSNYKAGAIKKYDCGSCHTTGYSSSGNQEGKPGVVGTWALDSIQCERCHGPGSDHIVNPAVEMTVDTSAAACGACHVRKTSGFPDSKIEAKSGFIEHHEQWDEMTNSPHSGLTCVTCHDPHKRADLSIKPTAECVDCHADVAADFEGSRKDQLGFECETCHMPKAGKSALSLGPFKGDVTTHLFEINTDPAAEQFYSEGGKSWSNAYINLDFACLGCHQGQNRAWAAEYAPEVHTLAPAPAPAGAGGGGPHGGYDLKTSKCAACLRAHTAVGENLLVEESPEALCLTCHGGTLATTDVLHGVSLGTGQRLNGGGFIQVDFRVTTSTHGPGDGTAWGGASSGAGVAGTLTCTSCHNPHGSTNYRILRDSQNGFPYDDSDCGGVPGCAAAAHRWIPDDPELLDWKDAQVVPTSDDSRNYAAGDNAYYIGALITGTDGHGHQTSDPELGMSAFCSTCHKQYLTADGSEHFLSTDADHYPYPGTQDAQDGKGDVARYRHAVQRTFNNDLAQPLRLAASGTLVGGEPAYEPPTYNSMTCLTCHFAHGTSAMMTGYAAGVDPTGDSALLYYDNRGVCVACHQLGK